MPSLPEFELSLGIPISRTIETLENLASTRYPWQPTDDDREYIAWVGRTHAFIQAISSRFWGDIHPDIYSSFTDRDSAPAFACEGLFPATRVPHPPTLRSTASRIGVTDRDLAAFAALWNASRSTDAYRAALATAAEVRQKHGLLGQMRQRQSTFFQWARSPTGVTLLDQRRAIAGRLDDIRTESAIEEPLRAYNELVQTSVGLTLAWAERTLHVPPFDPRASPVHVAVRGGKLELTGTTRGEGYWFLKILSPFEVALGTPLDGLYVCTSISMHGLDATGLVDLKGYRVRELESTYQT